MPAPGDETTWKSLSREAEQVQKEVSCSNLVHVLYLHQHFSTPDGSTGTRSYEFARRLIERGHSVTMVCGQFAVAKTGLSGEPVGGLRKGVVDGINVIEICLPYSNHDGLMRRAMTFIKFALRSTWLAWRTPYDVVFATSTPLTAGIPGILMRIFKPFRPFVFEVRDLWPELPREMGVVTNPIILFGMSCLEWLSYNSAKACIGLSPGICEGIRRRCSKLKSVTLIPNGCDLDLFESVANRQQPVSTDGPFTAVFTGAHGRANGLHAVLDAAAVLTKRGDTRVRIVFVGDGSEKPALMQRAFDDELTNCEFVDLMPKRELVDYLKTADVGLMVLDNIPAFYRGTSPNKFFDYIAAGLPILNNYPGWLAELIEKHDCGSAVAPSDADAFADALMRMSESPERLTEQGKNARNLAESDFNRSELADQFVDILEAYAG